MKWIAQSLYKGGVFGQWLQTYEMDLETIQMIMNTVYQVFPYASLYQIGHQDILILASLEKLKPTQTRFQNPFIQNFYKAMGFKKMEDIQITQILDSSDFHQIVHTSQFKINTLTEPQLIYRANKAMFLSLTADPFLLKNKFHIDTKTQTEKMKAFHKYKNKPAKEWEQECVPHQGFNFFCVLMHKYIASWNIVTHHNTNPLQRFPEYLFLRNHGLIPYNKKIMDEFLNEILKPEKQEFRHSI